MKILDYQKSFSAQWKELRSRIVARSHSWDFIEPEKVTYDHKSMELTLWSEESLVGYLDVEYEDSLGQVCWEQESLGAVVQEFGVKPEMQGGGLGKILLKEVQKRLLGLGIQRLEFWTKDPKSAEIYQHWGFRIIFTHQHYRLAEKRFPFLPKINGLNIEYGYVIDTDLKEVSEPLQEKPLGPHFCYGFCWDLKHQFIK